MVNTVPRTDKHFNPRYPTSYDHGYGYAWGTQGANCRHELYPYIEGVNTNPFHHPDTKKKLKMARFSRSNVD
ncbi:phage minor capsid protein [Companilactobacillus futsaii]|uniref:phage minor capsid protein n=1 Tax=Companilactobacillus futsaii TaxID=938155 RepID=UPI00398E87F0